MTTSIETEHTITRQLLPYGVSSPNGKYDRALWRWVTWDVEPITLEMAAAHLSPCGGASACVVRVRRGPKGGWTGATFVTAASDLPKQSQMSGKLPAAHTAHVTLYYGWKQNRVGNGRQGNVPVPLPDGIFGDHYRAHLVLHA